MDKRDRSLVSIPKVCGKHLESILGSLNHVANIYNPMRHFLGHIYQALYRANSSKGWTSHKATEVADFHTIITFLDSAKRGISMNNLTFRKPMHIYRSDASEFGLRGYNLISGIAWRYKLPVDCCLCTSLNSLKFLACVVNIWVDIFHNVIQQESCLLSQTDSSSASGWMRKSNFANKSEEAVQLSTARKLANLLISSESCLYSHWF
jgi:hypothetical protein